MDGSMSWTAWWGDADNVVRGIFLLLMVLSVCSWTILIYKWGQMSQILKQERHLRGAMEQQHVVDPTLAMLGEVVVFSTQGDQQAHREARVAQAVREKRVEMESGLTFLASIGVSSPFIGLLGTVWGIMHALAGLGHHASLSLDLVAGPVAEALVATATGLFAAIPAVVGYNMLIRRLRRLMTLAEGNLLRLLDGTQGGIDGRRDV